MSRPVFSNKDGSFVGELNSVRASILADLRRKRTRTQTSIEDTVFSSDGAAIGRVVLYQCNAVDWQEFYGDRILIYDLNSNGLVGKYKGRRARA